MQAGKYALDLEVLTIFQATHRKDIEKSKDDSKFEMRVNKPPIYQTQFALTSNTSEIPLGMPFPITAYMPPDYVPPSIFVGSISTPLMGGENYVEFRLTPKNFAISVRLQKKFQKQIDTQASQFNPFVDEIVDEAIRSFQSIHTRMDHMEEIINKRLDALSLPCIAKLMAKFEQAKADIAEQKGRQFQQPNFNPSLVVNDEDEGIVDLMVIPVKEKDKK